MLVRKLFALLIALLLTVAQVWGADPARAPDAVVRIESHGASATVIYSGGGRSYLLGCGHAYQGANKTRPMLLDVALPTPGKARQVGIKLLAVDYEADLSLVEVGTELPYVAPVAPAGWRPTRQVLSVGYDDMKWPAQRRPTTIQRDDGAMWWTRERPWHGRSGGGLIDMETGQLVGVCSGYTGPRNRAEVHPGANGLYVSHQAILRFLAKADGRPAPIPPRAFPATPPPLSDPFNLQRCPGGNCPGRQ